MKSITDEMVDITLCNREEFQAKWSKWIEHSLCRAYKILLQDNYNVEHYLNLPEPEFDADDAREDEQLTQALEGNLILTELKDDPDRFNKIVEEHKITVTELYIAYCLEVARCWRAVKPRYGTIRRIYYKGQKMFAQALRDEEFDERNDYALLTIAIRKMTTDATLNFNYADVWVQDTSRKIFKGETHRGWFNIILAVEKDAAVDDLADLGDQIGADLIVSGHGNPSNAASEKVLLLHQLRTIKRRNPNFSTIILIVVSDYDHAGMNSVYGGFVQQFSKICSNLNLELIHYRVGLLPHHVPVHRLMPHYTLFSPPQRGVLRCNKCVEWAHICNACGKRHSRKKKGTPRKCSSKNAEGEKCGESDWTSFKIGKKVKIPKRLGGAGNSGFLSKDSCKNLKSGAVAASQWEGKIACSCGSTDNSIGLEANPWTRVYGVPYCSTHHTCHTTDHEQFNDPAAYRQDDTCVIERYTIELDALGASYYYSDILEFLLKRVGIEPISQHMREKATPSDYDYQFEADRIAEAQAEETDEVKAIDAVLEQIEELRAQVVAERNKIVAAFRAPLYKATHDLVTQPEWDDRQRKWDSGRWDPDSVTEMHERHAKILHKLIKKGREVNPGKFGFHSRELEKKLYKILKEDVELGYIELEIPDDIEDYEDKQVVIQ